LEQASGLESGSGSALRSTAPAVELAEPLGV